MQLFDTPEPPVVEIQIPPGTNPLTAKRVRGLANGVHPVGQRRLHPTAPPVADKAAPGARCGNCAHAWRKGGWSDKNWWKCDTIEHSPDLSKWWPGCIYWEPEKEAQ